MGKQDISFKVLPVPMLICVLCLINSAKYRIESNSRRTGEQKSSRAGEQERERGRVRERESKRAQEQQSSRAVEKQSWKEGSSVVQKSSRT